ncbi:MAG: hypothetical protein QME47_07120 [Candidatus Thermoplasmatota archaeon]|nr:hypothetical protein [Candidatus Thermoplasmatota archaeon]
MNEDCKEHSGIKQWHTSFTPPPPKTAYAISIAEGAIIGSILGLIAKTIR